MRKALFVSALLTVCCAVASETEPTETKYKLNESVMATIFDKDGTAVGNATLLQTPKGLLVRAKISGLTPGKHGFHLHEKGLCELPDFKSAGGHLNTTNVDHGILVETGHHSGDMPNQNVGPDGRMTAEVLNVQLSLDDITSREEGVSIMIHSSHDDYRSQPSGAAGSRVACGVFK